MTEDAGPAVPEKYRVLKSYSSPYTEPLTLKKGERVRWEPLAQILNQFRFRGH